jgi:hypothetical protein
MPTKIIVPDDVQFADLKLQRDPDGALSFDWGPIERICAASHIDIGFFRGHDKEETRVSDLITVWYMTHRGHGGALDPIQEDLIAEVLAENWHGGGFSYEPGRG